MPIKKEIIIIGSGHNALVAACYLAQAGKKVLILEKNETIGGATVSQKTFPEYEARLSRYSYLISLLPGKIIDDLQLELTLLTRKTASYTPYGEGKGLLISNLDDDITKKSFNKLGHGEAEWQGYQSVLKSSKKFAELIWEEMLQPLKSKQEWKSLFKKNGEEQLWQDFVERPIGEFIEKHIKSDVLRGVLLTDAKIGSFTYAHDPDLLQNRTFIYHVIGNKTGEWKVPKGGMGHLINQLHSKALALGVEFLTKSEVTNIDVLQQIVITSQSQFSYNQLLFNAAPQVLDQLVLSKKPQISMGKSARDGTAFKINILLKRLPKLKDPSVSPQDAFCGTFHIHQNYSEQETSYREALAGKVPETFPCEMYCHTLTDDSILSDDLRKMGYHTITVFGLDMPYSLFEQNNEERKTYVWQKFLKGINSYLKEPFESCIATNKDGSLCVEFKSAVDLEKDLALPKGNIFHNDLSWFFAENDTNIGKWGVETPYRNINLCGSGALRGGAVSGIPGYLAAKKLLE
ncbi:MAG: NAD(P)/FAD-dependent oxidoreductase [Cytophagales bacterium]|nr:NAD(P)/FAD-dependent oxidoreductase [Cytophagales bacterium]